ncbi:MAG: diacylglycerol kinase [Woeseiaceae bacterium]|nr:diacylglycerol kinase [Woeseiaceae bacterium]
MGKPGNTGLLRAFRAARYSAQGLKQAWQHESAFRQEVMLLVVMIPLAIWLGRTLVEQALLIAVCLLVLLVELLNSAIEAAIDRQGSERHELSGRAKDMGSAAVSIALLIVVVVWSAVAIQRFT